MLGITSLLRLSESVQKVSDSLYALSAKAYAITEYSPDD